MKILIVGDIHGNLSLFKGVKKYARKNQIDLIIQLGDFGYYPNINQRDFIQYLKIDIPFYFIDGNHENHEYLDHNAETKIELLPNIWYCPRGYREKIGDYYFLFIGGATSIDAHLRTQGYDWFPTEVINYQQAQRALSYELNDFNSKPSVHYIISHEAPYFPNDYFSIPKTNYFPEDFSRQVVKECYERYKPLTLFHGHYHINYRNTANSIPGSHIQGLGCTYKDNKIILG